MTADSEWVVTHFPSVFSRSVFHSKPSIPLNGLSHSMNDQKQRGRRLIAKNSIFNLLGQIAPMLVGLLTIPYIVHGLGTAQYGILSIAMMLLGYFSIFDLGLSRATVKFVAENLAPDRVHKVPELVWTSLSLLVAIGS